MHPAGHPATQVPVPNLGAPAAEWGPTVPFAEGRDDRRAAPRSDVSPS
jgi:hypothetical protein